LAEAGGAIVIPESLLTQQTLTDNITTILSNAAGATQMAAAALSAGKPDATETLVALVEDLAKKDQ
jgi:UDP-N-acetylglucosamine--N-acetylmuramyl-(pentapeptide) pyrophosphoryl-undecaprenol N-acetylglucosamine transferase